MASKDTTPEGLSWTIFALTVAGAAAFVGIVAIFIL